MVDTIYLNVIMCVIFCFFLASVMKNIVCTTGGGLTGGVGKTTVLYRIKDGNTVNSVHTAGFNFETVEHNNVIYELWDIGGGDKYIALWYPYLQKTNGVIFVIDSTYNEGLETVKFELNRLLNEKELENCPFLLLANKQDLPNAVSLDDLKKELKLDQWKERNIHMLSAVATKGTGIPEGFEWLCTEISKQGR